MIKSRVVSDGVWVASGQAFSAVGQLLGIRLLTEYVSPGIFGLSTLLVGFITLFSVTFYYPALQGMSRYYPVSLKNDSLHQLSSATKQILRSKLTISQAILLGLAVIYIYIQDESLLLLPLLSSLLFLDLVITYKKTFFNSARQYKLFVLLQITESWGRPVLSVIFVLFVSNSVYGVLAGYILGSFLPLLLLSVFQKSNSSLTNISINNCTDKSIIQEIEHYSRPLIPTGIVGWISGVIDRYILAAMISLDKVGIYAAVSNLVSRPLMMSSMIAETTIRPALYDSVVNQEADKEKLLLLSWLGFSILIGLVFLIITSQWPNDVAALFLGEQYRSEAYIMPWIVCAFTALGISHIPTRVCYAHNCTKLVFYIALSGAISTVVLAVPMIYLFGFHGAIASLCIASTIQLLVSLIASHLCIRRQSTVSDE